MTSDESRGKGLKGGDRPGGPCWTCGGPHIQRESQHALAGKGNYPFTTAWSSWRRGTFLGPSAALRGFQNPWARGTAKANTKEEKDILKAREKGHLSEMEIVFFFCLWEQLQDSRSYASTGSSEKWVPDIGLHTLLPVCALSPSTRGNHPHVIVGQLSRPTAMDTGSRSSSWAKQSLV